MSSKFLLALIVAGQLGACMSFTDRPFRPVQDSIAADMPEIYLQKEMGIVVGGGMFDFLDVISLNDTDLSAIDLVQVAVYNIHPRGGNVSFSDSTFEQALTARASHLTWERIVRVRDDGEQVWIYAGMNLAQNVLEMLSVFVLERDELVLINMEGDLNQLLEYAMDHGRGHRGVYSGS